jgi:hypothetical protein
MEVVVEGAPGEISTLNATADGGGSAQTEISGDGTAFVSSVRWSALEKFRTYPYRVFLETAKPEDRSSCEQWTGKMRIAVR